MKSTPVRRIFFLSPLALIRVLLDIFLIGSWIWLASESLPQPLPALGAALFGAVSAGYWTMHGAAKRDEALQKAGPAGEEEIGRLTRFTSRPAREPVAANKEWFNDPELARRMQAEAERCEGLAIPMSVIFVRTAASSLTDLADGPAPTTLPDVLARLLDGSRQKHVCSTNGGEAVIAFSGGDRAAAEDLLKRLCRQLDFGECEAGIVIHPDDGIDPAALASVARLRLHQIRGSGSSSPITGTVARPTDSPEANPRGETPSRCRNPTAQVQRQAN